GIELEFGAAPDPPGAALDANPAGLPRRDQRIVIVRHAGPLPSVVIPAQSGSTCQPRRCRIGGRDYERAQMKIRDVKTYVLEAALTEPFAYSQAWYERRGACLVEIVGEDGNSGWGEAFGPPRLTAPIV